VPWTITNSMLFIGFVRIEATLEGILKQRNCHVEAKVDRLVCVI
jgi:hypothetical protein